MQASGHHVTTSSGTTGRTSFLNMNDADLEWMKVAFDVGVREVTGHTNSDRAAFLGIAPGNSFMPQLVLANAAAAAARPDDIHYMADEPLRAADLAAMGELRAAIADGTATPAEIVEAEKTARAREERVTAQLDQLLEQILARREEPIMVAGAEG